MYRARGHRQQPIERLPQHLGFTPTESLFGSAIKAHNLEIVVQRDDRIGGDINDSGERRAGVRGRSRHELRHLWQEYRNLRRDAQA